MDLKSKLRNNELTIGSWLTIGHQSIVEIMASAGFDWLTIDMEHSVIDLTMAQSLIGHIQSYGMKALVRVSKNEEVIIKRVMDAGADGIIVPMVNSPEDARRAVEYTYYPPKGKRGVGLARAQNYGPGFNEYKEWLNRDCVIIAQIEHIDAVNELEKILETEEIDGIIIGPYDLSGSLGIPGEYEKEEVRSAISRVEHLCKKLDKPLGYHVIEPDYLQLREKVNEGYRFLAFSLDFLFLGTKAVEEVRKFNEDIQ